MGGDLTQSVLIGALIGGVVVTIGVVIGFLRSGAGHLGKMTRRRLSFATSMRPAEAFARLERFDAGKTSVAASDAAAGRIVFKTPITFTTWGFFHPVFVAADDAGGSRVEIGCASRGMQYGPLVTRAHEKFVEALQRHMGVGKV